MKMSIKGTNNSVICNFQRLLENELFYIHI